MFSFAAHDLTKTTIRLLVRNEVEDFFNKGGNFKINANIEVYVTLKVTTKAEESTLPVSNESLHQNSFLLIPDPEQDLSSLRMRAGLCSSNYDNTDIIK